MRSHWILFVISFLFLSGCNSFWYHSKYYDFADNKDNVQFRANIVEVPNEGNDGWIYYCRRGPYDNRQVVLKDMSEKSLINYAFQPNELRTIWEYQPNDEKRYISEIIVPEEDASRPYLRQVLGDSLKAKFEIRVDTFRQETPVLILQQDTTKDLAFDKWNEKNIKFSWDKGLYEGEGITLGMLGAVFEDYFETPIIDGTSNDQRYNINLSWEPNNLANLTDQLRKHGLYLEKDSREMKFWRISKNPSLASN